MIDFAIQKLELQNEPPGTESPPPQKKMKNYAETFQE